MAKQRSKYCRKVKIGRYILVLCLLSFSAAAFCPLQAQPRLRMPKYWVGVHGGVSASTVAFSPRVEGTSNIVKASVLGGNGGFVFRYAGHKYCALQMELNYVHRGWAEHIDTIGSYSRRLHYIEIPMLMHLNFGSDKCRWFLNAGPQIGYCIKDEGNHGTLVNGQGKTEYEPIKKRFDWGVLVGTGFYVITKKAGIYQFDVRFDYSFGGIYGTNLTDHFSTASPMDLSINLGWLMPVRSRKTKVEGQKTKAEHQKL